MAVASLSMLEAKLSSQLLERILSEAEIVKLRLSAGNRRAGSFFGRAGSFEDAICLSMDLLPARGESVY